MWTVLTKQTIKDVRALESRRQRLDAGAWVAEGGRLVGELLQARVFECQRVAATAEWWQAHAHEVPSTAVCHEVTHDGLARLSLLQTPHDVLAVFALPRWQDTVPPASCLSLLLDEVQDPGNMGTILRTADWFGVRHVFCTPGTADCFAPKVVQATMGALARVRVTYLESDALDTVFWSGLGSLPVFGTFLEGDNLFQTSLPVSALLVMGNEGRGISPTVADHVNRRVHIPAFPPDGVHVESLNVGVATALCLQEWRRRNLS